MTLVELKKSIHEKIDTLDDENLLEMVNSILIQNNEVFIIPEHMKEGIKQGKRDIENGDIYTMEELEKKYEKWLNA
jgi:predicted transcriptional regulator